MLIYAARNLTKQPYIIATSMVHGVYLCRTSYRKLVARSKSDASSAWSIPSAWIIHGEHLDLMGILIVAFEFDYFS